MNFHENASKQQKSIVYLYVADFEEKNKYFLIFLPFKWFDKKQFFKQIQIFLRIALFKPVKKNKLSEYFSALFGESHFFDKNEKFSVNFPKNASKPQKSIVYLYVADFEENFFLFVNISPILLV